MSSIFFCPCRTETDIDDDLLDVRVCMAFFICKVSFRFAKAWPAFSFIVSKSFFFHLIGGSSDFLFLL